MIEASPTGSLRAPAALSFFLRGIERHAAVFAELLAGDPGAAERAYAVALRQFREQAAGEPYGQWPRVFWRTLVAAPELRRAVPAPRWAPPFGALAALAPGPRAVLLLRLAAALADVDGAAVLGVALPTYQRALQRALPRDADGRPDLDALRGLAAAVRQAILALPPERLAHLARLREAAVQGRRPELIGPMPASAQAAAAVPERPHARLRGLLWGGVAACALGLVGSFVWQPGGDDPGDGIRVQPLAPAAPPSARYDPALALLTGRDFELLAASPPRPPVDDPAFYAWYAAQQAGAPVAGAGGAEPPPRGSAAARPESIDAP